MEAAKQLSSRSSTQHPAIKWAQRGLTPMAAPASSRSGLGIQVAHPAPGAAPAAATRVPMTPISAAFKPDRPTGFFESINTQRGGSSRPSSRPQSRQGELRQAPSQQHGRPASRNSLQGSVAAMVTKPARQRPATASRARPATASKSRPSTATRARPATASRRRPSTASRRRPSTAARDRPGTAASHRSRPRTAASRRPPTATSGYGDDRSRGGWPAQATDTGTHARARPQSAHAMRRSHSQSAMVARSRRKAMAILQRSLREERRIVARLGASLAPEEAAGIAAGGGAAAARARRANSGAPSSLLASNSEAWIRPSTPASVGGAALPSEGPTAPTGPVGDPMEAVPLGDTADSSVWAQRTSPAGHAGPETDSPRAEEQGAWDTHQGIAMDKPPRAAALDSDDVTDEDILVPSKLRPNITMRKDSSGNVWPANAKFTAQSVTHQDFPPHPVRAAACYKCCVAQPHSDVVLCTAEPGAAGPGTDMEAKPAQAQRDD